MRLALTGATIISSISPPSVATADILVEHGRVAAVGVPVPDGVARLDCSGCLVVPGNVCAHTHLYSALARGMPGAGPAPRSFIDILRRVWWRLDRALDDETIRASALLGGLEALRAGTTTVIDHHASPNAVDGSLDVIAEALAELGIRSVLCYETSDRDGPDVAAAGLAENARLIHAIDAGRWPLSRAMVGAHASFTLTRPTLDAVAALARDTGRGLHIHAAEDRIDETDARVRFERSVGARLRDAGALDARTLLAHGVHLDPDEAELVRGSGSTVVHNPRSNLNNAVGRPPLDLLGPRVALGTDGIGADMFEEVRTAYFARRSEAVTTGPDWALDRLAHGASVAGTAFDEPSLGRITAGAPADLVVLDAPPPTPLHAGNVADQWIFGLSAAAVRDVLVDGRLVLTGRRPAVVDPGDVAELTRGAARRLWSRLESIAEHPFDPISVAPLGAGR